jgi:hypothetical protein
VPRWLAVAGNFLCDYQQALSESLSTSKKIYFSFCQESRKAWSGIKGQKKKVRGQTSPPLTFLPLTFDL